MNSPASPAKTVLTPKILMNSSGMEPPTANSESPRLVTSSPVMFVPSNVPIASSNVLAAFPLTRSLPTIQAVNTSPNSTVWRYSGR